MGWEISGQSDTKWYRRNHTGHSKAELGSDKPWRVGKSLHYAESQFPYLLHIEISTGWFVWSGKFTGKA